MPSKRGCGLTEKIKKERLIFSLRRDGAKRRRRRRKRNRKIWLQPFRKFGVPPESLLTLTPLHPPQSLSGPTSRERLTGEGRGKKKFGKSGGERRAARERHRERNEVNALFKRATGSRRGMSVYTRSPSVTHPSTDISRTETRSYRRRSSTPGGGRRILSTNEIR